MTKLKPIVLSVLLAAVVWLIIQYGNIEAAIVFLAALVGYFISLNKNLFREIAKSPVQTPDKPEASPAPEKDSENSQSYSVMIIDNFNRHDSDSRFDKTGFESKEHALEYGMRRVRSSVKQCCKDGQTKEQNYSLWMAMGEEVSVDGVRLGSVYYDDFYESNPTAEECDYVSLTPKQPKRGNAG